MRTSVFILVVVVFFSCKKTVSNLSVIAIDFDDIELVDLQKQKESKIILELSDDSMLARIDEVYVYKKDFIFIRSQGELYLFDKKGKFLNKIGRKGNGPSEFTHFNSFFIKNEQVQIYDAMQKKILCYNFNGSFIKSINLQSVFTNILPNSMYLLPNGNFVSKNTYGGVSRKTPSYSFLNEEFKITSSSENRILKDGVTVLNSIYTASKQILFWEILNDTIFSLESKGGCSPKYFVDFKEKALSKSVAKQKDLYAMIAYTNKPEVKNKIASLIRNVKEDDAFLRFTFVFKERIHYVKYHKKTKRVKTYSFVSEGSSIESVVKYQENRLFVIVQTLDIEESNPKIYILNDTVF